MTDGHLGWLLGRRFLRLTHRGRITGRQYWTVLEVIGERPARRRLVAQLPIVALSPSGQTSYETSTLLDSDAHPQAMHDTHPARSAIRPPREAASDHPSRPRRQVLRHDVALIATEIRRLRPATWSWAHPTARSDRA